MFNLSFARKKWLSLLVSFLWLIPDNAEAQLTGIKTIGSGGDFPTLAAAVAALNSQGPGTGGVTFNIKGGHTETVAGGITSTSPVTPAGLLITRGGTVANPVIIKWDGTGTKPIFTSGNGVTNRDFVIGIAGQDYITIDGLKVVDNPAHANNNLRAEIGIGLFKERYSTSLGNNGCQHVTIRNCEITLTRYPNTYQKVGAVLFPLTSAGIVFSHFTSRYQGSTSVTYWTYSNPNQGIKSAEDVHSHNLIVGNKIDNCTNGIRIQDAWLQKGTDLFAGTGNVVGRSGEGNEITNFGPLSTVSYDGRTHSNNNNFSSMPAIDVGGQKDFYIEYNIISGCEGGGANGARFYTGIHAGMSAGGAFALPRNPLSNFRINHNVISNISADNSSSGRHAIGINFSANDDGNQVKKGGGNIEIRYNTISNLTANRGYVMGIGSQFAENHIVAYNQSYRSGYQSTGTVSISNNTISNLSRASNIVNSVLSAIYWRHGSRSLAVNDNQISNLTYGTAGTTPVAGIPGLMGIYISSQYNTVTREVVEVKNNVIDNADVLAATGSRNPVASSVIGILSGGASNLVENNEIRNCNLYSSVNTKGDYRNFLIWVWGKPRSGASSVTITGNSLLNNSRTGLYANSNVGYRSPFIGISADYTGGNQTRIISNNHIENLSQSSHGSHSAVSYSLIRGIYIKGRTSYGNSTVITGNTVKGLAGVSSAYNQQAAYNTGTVYWRYPMAAIAAEIWNQLTISNNNITDLESVSSAWATDGNSVNGPAGIVTFNNTEARNTTASIVNNFISDLRAPAMRGRLAINGVALTGRAFKHNVYHNTIVIGAFDGDASGRITSSTGGAFGVTGLLISTYHTNNRKYLLDFRNNIISINATARGTGSAMAVRSLTVSGIKKVPLSIDRATNGNAYFINSDLRNYIYGQGAVYNASGGIRNAFAFSGATANATYNLVNDGVDLNTSCGAYKTFMAGAEKESAVDHDGVNIAVLPFTGSGNIPDKFKITDGAVSALFNARRISSPLVVDKDYFQGPRATGNVTAGAHEVDGSSTVNEIAFDFEAVTDGICQDNPSLSVTIIAPEGKTIQAAGPNAPRLYFRRVRNANALNAAQSDNNVMPAAVDNNAAGPEGWRWVQPVSNTGSVFSFVFDLSLLKSTIVTTPTYTIEYFVGAQTADGSKAGFSSGDWSLNTATGSSTCPGTIALETYTVPPVPADPSVTTLEDNSVTDNFTIYRGADLSKAIELAQASVCEGGEVSVIAHYSVTATGEQIGSLYRFQVADNNLFTLNLQEFDQADSIFNYTTSSNTTKYIRSWLICGSSTIANTNSNAVTLTVGSVPVNTSEIADRNSCANLAQSYTLTSTSNPTNQPRYYWLVSPKLKVFNNAPVASSAASVSFSVTPGSAEHSGTWNSYVTTSNAGTLPAAGYRTADFDGSETGKFEPGAGLALTVNQFIKLNSVKVKDELDDDGATSTDDFYVRLYTSEGYLLYSQTVATNIANGGIITVNLSNWYIAPGQYLLVMEAVAAEPESGYTSALVSVSPDFPVENPGSGTSVFSITGGVGGLAFDEDNGEVSYEETSDYNYFFDLNVNAFCTSNAKPLEWTINPASCCASPAPSVNTIADATVSDELVSSDCKLINGWFYYFDPASPARLLFAVNPNGNDFNPESLVVNNSGTAGDASHRVSTGGYNAELMPYVAYFATSDELTVNGGLKVRMFYPAAQKGSVDAGSYDVSSWFTFPGTKEDIIDNLTGTGLESATLTTPSGAGTENSVPYVEFENITSTSSFGYLRFDRALKVEAKVLLQGAMPLSGTEMRTDLQDYLSVNGVALLPTTNPYGVDGSYDQINDPSGPAGAVVDWVLLELREAANPLNILAKGAFLLKPDGTIVDPEGNASLSFGAALEQVPMHLVVRHRNHLALISPVISTFVNDILVHDFSAGLDRAHNPGGDPDQMVEVNGAWTMISGDANTLQDLTIDNIDRSLVYIDFLGGEFDSYLASDLNMDGIVDILDIPFINNNFLSGYYSSLINY